MWGPSFRRSLYKSHIIMTAALAVCLGLLRYLVFHVQTPVICLSLSGSRCFPKPVVASSLPAGLGSAVTMTQQHPCDSSRRLVYQRQSSTLTTSTPVSFPAAIPGSPCYGVLPFISSVFIHSFNHFFFCQHYFKHEYFLCRCLSHQNNDRLQSDPQLGLASLG